MPDGWDADLPFWEPGSKPLATRAASGQVLTALGPTLPELWGGSADLAGSNNTTIKGADSFGPPSISTKDYTAHWYGRTLHFGIREHAMGAILSGIVLHGPTRAYGGTFLQFSDYMRPAVRLASLMNIDTIYVWTHDSIGLGEDGPTHQPIEHLAALRAIPNLSVVRPGDAERDRVRMAHDPVSRREQRPGRVDPDPSGHSGSRGHQQRRRCQRRLRAGRAPRRGARRDSDRHRFRVATGRRRPEDVGGQGHPCQRGVDAVRRVVRIPVRSNTAIPCCHRRCRRESPSRPAVAQSWYKLVGDTGEIVSIEHYGESADAKTLFREFGFTPEAVVDAAERSLDN